VRTKAFYDGFADDRGPASDFRVVMFLLAVVTSEPDAANALFHELETPATAGDRQLGALVMAACVAAPRLLPVADWLTRPENAAWSSLTEAPLHRWWREVIRYSFRPRHVSE